MSNFNGKSPSVLNRQLSVQRVVIPFSVTANVVPASVILRNDEPTILYIQSQGVNQISDVLAGESFPSLPSGSPVMGTASSYAILAASAITNTGSSVVTGNLGLYPGTSVTGFPPGIVSGTQNITNAAAQVAQVSALAAYTDLAARSSTIIASALDGQTLSAGVYSFASGAATLATSGAGTLTFSGSATDIFVIKTASTLTTGAGGVPTITLSGGALASNVYWVVGSSATINAGTAGIFRGILIASASITNTLGGTVDGSLIALNGAITLSAASIVTLNANPPAVTQFTSSPPSDVLGTLNFLVRVQETLIKVCGASFFNRTTGVSQPVFLGDADGIASNGTDILLAMDSSVNFSTTNLDGSISVEYIVR